MLLFLSFALADWPDRTGEILPMMGHEVQWVSAWDDLAAPVYARDGQDRYEDGVIPRERWAALGIRAEGWWVLPEDGSAAVPSRVTSVRYASPGECGGYIGIAVDLDGPPAWAAVMGVPPDSWHVPVVGPDVEIAARLDAWLAANRFEPRGDWSWQWSWAAAEEIAVVRITESLYLPHGDDEAFGDPHVETNLRIDATGVHELSRKRYHQYAEAQVVRALRDIDGDGALDVVEGDCARVVHSLDGRWSVSSIQNVCCGC